MPPVIKWSQTAKTITLIIQSIPTFDNIKTVSFDNYNLILYDNVTDMTINTNGIQPKITFQKSSPVFWNKVTESPEDFIIKIDWDRWISDETDDEEVEETNPGFDFNGLNLGQEHQHDEFCNHNHEHDDPDDDDPDADDPDADDPDADDPDADDPEIKDNN